MLVEVVRMRTESVKLLPDQIKAATPMRGRLIIATQPWSEHATKERVRTTFAYLIEPRDDKRLGAPLIPFLRAAHVNKLDGESFVLFGIEKPSVEFNAPEWPQAWWCRLVTSRRAAEGLYRWNTIAAGDRAMNREALSAAKPKWLELEHQPAAEKLGACVRYVEAIMNAIGAEKREPDTWEAMHISYAIHAIVEERYYGALTFAEMALIDPAVHRPPRLLPDGPEPVKLALLQEALALLKAKRMPKR
jgi:hypothetical protein